jgi:hypothetical protein
MEHKRVKDLMISLDEYPVVSPDMNLLEAILTITEAQKKRSPRLQPYRAVLVADSTGKIIGKLGQLAFLKALEPKYRHLGDLQELKSAGLSDEIITMTIEHYRFLEAALPDLCAKGRDIKVREAMHPIAESIDENASLCEAINKIVIYQQMSLLVMRGPQAVGVLRLSDLCDEVARQMKKDAGIE